MASTLPTNSDSHLPNLDGLRGLAAVMVVISHCANRGYLPPILGQGFGQMGVALFYALSGLLMARLYLDQPFERQTLRIYAWRRGARVLPLYFAALALGVLFFTFDMPLYKIGDIGDVMRAALLIHGTGVLWSIPVEIQFYVVFAGIWYLSSRGYLITSILGLLVLQAAFVVTHYVNLGLENIYVLSFWLHFFLVGVVLGYLSTSERFMQSFGNRSKAFMIGSALLLACAVLAPPGIRNEIGIPKTYVFADPISAGYPLALLVAGLLNLGFFGLFASKPLRWLGKVSFSIYLMHMPVILLIETALPGDSVPPWQKAVLVFVITFAVSSLTENYIEKAAQRAILRRALPSRPAPAGAEIAGRSDLHRPGGPS